MANMEWYEWTLIAIVLVGGLNWGLVSVGFNLVEWLATMIGLTWLENVIYGLVGVASIVSAVLIVKNR